MRICWKIDGRKRRKRHHGRGCDALINPPAPPPVTMEQLMGMQAQLMQAMMQRLDNEPARGLPPVQVRDKRGEFMKGRPPVFTHATDPMEVDDWLRAVEKQLNIAQCNDLEKVLYASGQLQGAAQDWWDSFQTNIPTILLLSPGRNSRTVSDLIISLMDSWN